LRYPQKSRPRVEGGTQERARILLPRRHQCSLRGADRLRCHHARGDRVRIAAEDGRLDLPVGREDAEARPVGGIRRHAVVLQRLVDAVIPGADLHDLPRFLGGRDLAAELLAQAHGSLDLLDGRLALAVGAPEVVFVVSGPEQK